MSSSYNVDSTQPKSPAHTHHHKPLEGLKVEIKEINTLARGIFIFLALGVSSVGISLAAGGIKVSSDPPPLEVLIPGCCGGAIVGIIGLYGARSTYKHKDIQKQKIKDQILKKFTVHDGQLFLKDKPTGIPASIVDLIADKIYQWETGKPFNPLGETITDEPTKKEVESKGLPRSNVISINKYTKLAVQRNKDRVYQIFEDARERIGKSDYPSGQSNVHKITNLASGTFQFSKSAIEPVRRKALKDEQEIMRHAGRIVIASVESQVEDQESYVLVLPLATGGDFFTRIEQGVSWASFKESTDQLIDDLLDLHSKGIYHRDIKPDNIVIFEEEEGTRYQICDFGTSIILDGTTEESFQEALREKGTTYDYTALDDHLAITKENAPQFDVFNFGTILFLEATGSFPYRHIEHTPLVTSEPFRREKLMRGLTTKYNLPPDKADKLANLIQWMTDPDINARPTMEQVKYDWKNIINDIDQAQQQ